MIALRTPGVPQQAHLLATSALRMRAPSTSNTPRLHTEGAIATELLRTLAPTVLIDTLVAIFAYRVAEVIGLLKALRALADHLSNISEPCLQPACLVIVRAWLLKNGRRRRRLRRLKSLLFWMFLLCLRRVYRCCRTRLLLCRCLYYLLLQCFQGLLRCLLC